MLVFGKVLFGLVGMVIVWLASLYLYNLQDKIQRRGLPYNSGDFGIAVLFALVNTISSIGAFLIWLFLTIGDNVTFLHATMIFGIASLISVAASLVGFYILMFAIAIFDKIYYR